MSLTSDGIGTVDLVLELDNAVQKGFRGRRATGDINIDRDDTVASAHHRVGVVIITAAIGAGAHGYHPARLRHLVIHLAESRRHFITKGSGNNHDVRLTRAGTKHNSKAVEIVTGCACLHHFDGAACQAKSHRPHRAGTPPVDDRVKAGSDKAFFHYSVRTHGLNPTPERPSSTRK